MANEYIFFDSGLCERFMRSIAERGIRGDMRPDTMEGFVVAVPDTLADDLEEAIELEYMTLMEEQRNLVDATEGDRSRSLMGVVVTLPNGAPCVVRIPAVYARRLYEHFTIAETHELVSAIAASLSNPFDGPLCRSPKL